MLAHEFSDDGIFDRQNAIKHFDDGHVRAHAIVEAGELNSDGARSDNQQLTGHFRRSHGMAIGPDALSIRLRERKLPRAGAGGDTDVLRLNIRCLTVLGDTELAFARQLAVATIDSDLVRSDTHTSELQSLMRI